MTVSVIVPVFNAAEHTAECLRRLESLLPDSWQVQIVDDASTDRDIAPLLAKVCERNPGWHLVTHSVNRGFVRSCNEAVGRCRPADHVLLLNTDTLPNRHSLINMNQALISDSAIASVTPFSNNAEICSLPVFCQNNPLPARPDEVAELLASNTALLPAIPTAVGFCMLIRRELISKIGLFDADHFGRGYGEENDFCLRASAAGYYHVLCDNAYVPHVGGASFGPLGLQPGPDTMARLVQRHPGYPELISDFIQRDPCRPARERAIEHLSRQGVSLTDTLQEAR